MLALTICSLWKSNVREKESMRKCWSTVSAWLILLTMIKICYGCANQGCVDMKHPDPREYDGGHLDMGRPFECVEQWSDSEDDAEYVKAKEAKIRRMYEGLDDPGVVEELFRLRKALEWMSKEGVRVKQTIARTFLWLKIVHFAINKSFSMC